MRSRDGMAAMSKRAGEEASFTGFMTPYSDSGADEFVLSRFMISCCVADALAVRMRVVDAPPGQFKPDDWVRVTEKLYPLGREVVIDAANVAAVSKPKLPYLNP